jgi:hypothetical protein
VVTNLRYLSRAAMVVDERDEIRAEGYRNAEDLPDGREVVEAVMIWTSSMWHGQSAQEAQGGPAEPRNRPDLRKRWSG